MKERFVNKVLVQGYVFNHTLETRVTGPNSKNPNVPFINGQVNIATDEEGLNVIPVYFTYVTEFYNKSGKPNTTYAALKKIIDAEPNEEIKVRVDGQIELNDWYNKEGELISAKRVGGSFLHIMNEKEAISNTPNYFETDMLISKSMRKESQDGKEYLELGGYCFNFRNDFLPISLTIRTPEGIDYFENEAPSNSNPLLTKVWGEIISTTVEKGVEVESAFGAPVVKTTSQSFRAWDVTGAAKEPMEFGEESVMTIDDVKKGLAKREEYLAGIKQRQEEYQNKNQQKTNGSGFPVTASSNVSPTANENFPF